MSESTRVRYRRGTASQHESFTGASSELTVNTTNKSLHVHDGVTAGGVELARSDLANINVGVLTNVQGANFSGVVTSSSFNGTNFIGTNFSGAYLNAGIGTLTHLNLDTLNVSLASTSNSYYVGIYEIIDSSRQLKNITSLDSTTTLTIENAIASAPNNFTTLNIGTSGTTLVASANNLVGIGSTIPQYKLDVLGDINFTGTFYQGGTQFVASRWTAGIDNDIYRLNGDVGIGTTNPQYTLDVHGDLNFTGTFRQNGSQFIASRWVAGSGDDIYRLTDVGIGTTNPRYQLEVGPVGAAGTQLWVNGDARVTGILSIGQGTVTIDGSSNIVNVGMGLTIDGVGNQINVGSAVTIHTSGFQGSGAALHTLNASNLATGTISSERFDNSSNAFGFRYVQSGGSPTGGSDGDLFLIY